MNKVGDFIYIFGGVKSSGIYIDEIFKLNTNTFEIDQIDDKGSRPDPRAYHGYKY